MSWSSSDESIATVDKNGKVKGIAEGKATITVKSGDFEASCEVTVILVHAKSVSIVGDGIENGKLKILKGKQIQLSEVTEPAEHTDEITWSSSNTEVLSVLEWAPGYFNAKAPGTSTVTVTVGEVSASIEVEVYEAPVEKITLDKTEVTILTVETLVLNATVEPKEHTDGNIEWSSSDETVVTAAMGTNTSGTITPVGVGEATVTAKVGNASVTCKVTVKEPEEGTVIWKYDGNTRNGWPQNMSASYGIGALIMNGAKFDSVAEENGVYTVTLPHATAKDAEISLKAYACGMSPQNLGVNWHEGEVDPQSWNDYANKLEHTFSLTDGEATLKIRAYKASGAGASREGTKTFKFVIDGECTFDQKVASEEHLATEATCTEAATYYMSCVCGETGTESEPFSYGDPLDHDWGEPEYKWADDGSSCEAKRVCNRNQQHVENAKAAEIKSEVAKPATCSAMGDTRYEAIFEENWAHDYKTVTDIEIDKDAHAWAVSYDWSEDGKACTATKACANNAEHNLTAEATVTSVVAKEANCSAMGDTQYTATFAADWAETQVTVRTDIAIDEDAHEWGEWKVVREATYKEKGLKERECKLCEDKETDDIPKLKKPSKPSKPSDKPNPGVTVIVPGNKGEEEKNPNTGAPVFDMTFAGAVVLAATAIFLGKKNK